MARSVLILSGGLDSTVSAYLAQQEGELSSAVFFHYGQRAAVSERLAVTAITERLRCPLRVLDVTWLGRFGESALTDEDQTLPQLAAKDLDKKKPCEASAASVWVPNRNGVFLNIAAAIAESIGADQLVTGFNCEEAATFPDNSRDFVASANEFFSYSTKNAVTVVSYTQDWDKTEIVRQGLKRDVPFDLIWSCYEGGAQMCGKCESCRRSVRAYQAAGIWDKMQHRFQ